LVDLSPALGKWLNEQVYVAKLTLRSFLRGYNDGKSQEELKDWQQIQSDILQSIQQTQKPNARRKQTSTTNVKQDQPTKSTVIDNEQQQEIKQQSNNTTTTTTTPETLKFKHNPKGSTFKNLTFHKKQK
jgi:hypothetical protein